MFQALFVVLFAFAMAAIHRAIVRDDVPLWVDVAAAAFAAFVGLILMVTAANADTILAEEIEVPPPEWSVLFEEPTEPPPPPVLLAEVPPIEVPQAEVPQAEAPPASSPTGGPSVVPAPVPVSWCWLSFVDCDNGGGSNSRKTTSPPAPVPEPGAALLFAAGLLLLRGCRR